MKIFKLKINLKCLLNKPLITTIKILGMSLALSVCFLLSTSVTNADVWCDITNFEVDAYNHGGVYLHGAVGGIARGFIHLGGVNGDFNAKATDRRLSLALSAQMANKDLKGLFAGISSCSEINNYDSPVSLVVKR